MSQNFNEEFIPKISQAIETLETTVVANIKTGLTNVTDMADATGSAKFIESANALSGGTEELMKAAEELISVLENTRNQYSKLQTALS